MSTTKQLKTLLRRNMGAMLSQVSSEEIVDQSTLSALKLRSLESYRRARNVGFFMNMDISEVKTMKMIQTAFQDDKNIYLPRCFYEVTNPEIENDPKYSNFSRSDKKLHLNFYRVDTFQEVLQLEPQGPYKLKEPESISPEKDVFNNDGLDLIIVPAVAFSISTDIAKDSARTINDKKVGKRGIKRLGHGAGFYDEYFKRHERYTSYNEKRSVYLLGLGMEEQLVDDLPVDGMDVLLDGLLVNGSFYSFE